MCRSILEVRRRVPVVLATIFVSAGCASTASLVPAAVGGSPVGAAPSAAHGITQAQMLVRRASMELEVDSLERVTARTTAIAGALGGYVHASREAAERRVTITIRVPSPALDEAMDSVAMLGVVEGRRISADDVTDQIVDLDGRVATLRATRDRLRALLSQASGVSDVITVERELHRVQTELESLDRRLIALRSSAALADLSIDAHRPRILGPLGYVFAGVGWLLSKAFVIR